MTRVRSIRRSTRRLHATLYIVVAAALVAPLVAQGRSDDDGLRIRFETPVTFADGTPECPDGIAHFGISALGKTGSAMNCLQEFVPVDCPTGVVALFCQEIRLLMTLRLPGGVIEAEVRLFEIARCGDAACNTLAIDQRWPGTVVNAKGRFHKLENAAVSGGGVIVLDAVGIRSLDEVILIEGDD